MSVGTIGSGAQAGFYWDQDGVEWVISTDQQLTVTIFGARGDGITDDTAAIQLALNYISRRDDKEYHLIFPYGRYKTTSVLYLPFGIGDFQRTNHVFITALGAVMVGSGSSDANHKCFESAYWDSGVVTTSVGTTGETHLAFGVKIRGFGAENYTRVFDLQNFNQGCSLEEIHCRTCQQAVRAQRCFYMSFQNIFSTGTPTQDTKSNFEFKQFVNIQTMRALKSSDHSVCIEVSGADGATIHDCGLEDCDIGLLISGQCNRLTLDNAYLEAIGTAGIQFNSVCRGLNIQNSFFNTGITPVIGSTLSNAQSAQINLLNNDYNSGDWTLPDNIFINRLDGSSNRNAPGFVFGTNPKLIDLTPEVIVDTASLGNAGPIRFINASVEGIFNVGHYQGRFGDGRINGSNRLNFGTYQDNNGAGQLQIDSEIDFTENFIMQLLIEYVHSGGTYDEVLMCEGQTNGTAVIYGRKGGVTTYLDPATQIEATNNAGKVRLTVKQHASHTLVKGIIRLI